MQLPFPLLRPPSPDEARHNAEGNVAHVEMTIGQELAHTARNIWETITGVPRVALISVPASVAAKTLNSISNASGTIPLAGLRVSKYIEEARDAIRRFAKMDWLLDMVKETGGGHAHVAAAGAH